MWKFQDLIKKEMEFPSAFMKESCEFPWVLVFDLETSKGVSPQVYPQPPGFSGIAL